MIDKTKWQDAVAKAIAASILEEAEEKKRAEDPNSPPALRRPRRGAVTLGPTPGVLEAAPKGARTERDEHTTDASGEVDLAHHARHVVAVARQRKARGLVLEDPQGDTIPVTLVF